MNQDLSDFFLFSFPSCIPNYATSPEKFFLPLLSTPISSCIHHSLGHKKTWRSEHQNIFISVKQVVHKLACILNGEGNMQKLFDLWRTNKKYFMLIDNIYWLLLMYQPVHFLYILICLILTATLLDRYFYYHHPCYLDGQTKVK